MGMSSRKITELILQNMIRHSLITAIISLRFLTSALSQNHYTVQVSLTRRIPSYTVTDAIKLVDFSVGVGKWRREIKVSTLSKA
jgi:hypothetical protein